MGIAFENQRPVLLCCILLLSELALFGPVQESAASEKSPQATGAALKAVPAESLTWDEHWERLRRLRQREKLLLESRTLRRGGELDSAASKLELALDETRAAVGAQHSLVATTLTELGAVHIERGEFETAAGVFQVAATMLSELHGNTSVPAIDSRLKVELARALGAMTEEQRVARGRIVDRCNQLVRQSRASHRQGQFENAVALMTSAVDLSRSIYFTANHPLVAREISYLASLQEAQNEYAAAAATMQEAIEIYRNVYGDSSPPAIQELLQQRTLQLLARMDEEARTQHERWHQLSDEAGSLAGAGRFREAAESAEHALATGRKLHGEEHPLTAVVLDLLSGYYTALGDYSRARLASRRALEISQKAFGREHPVTAQRMINFGMCASAVQEYELAIQLHHEALTVLSRGPSNYSTTSTALHNLGALYSAMGHSEDALNAYWSALELRLLNFGPEHRFTIRTLDHLGTVYRRLEEYEKASECHRAALTLRQQVLSPDHPAIAISSVHLGRLYEATLDFEQAQSAYEQTLRILTSAWGNAHPSAVDALSDVGRISLKRGCRARASECMQRVIQFRLREVASAAIVQSERRQLATVSRLRGSLDAWLSISAPREEEDDSLQGVESTYEGVFAWKGQVLTRQRHVRLSSLEEELVPRFNELQAVTTTLASVSRAYPDDPRREGAWRIQMQRLLEERERREIELKQQSRIYREATGDVTVTDLRRLLPHRTVVIDFLEYKQSVCIDKERDVWTHQPCLVGFVVPATEMGHRIARIELGSVRPIAEAIAAWREGGYGATLEAAAAIATLRQLIWEPLLPYIEQADTILLSPDGVLGRLPFAVLPGRRPGSYLIEDHRLAFVPAARLLCDLLSRPKSSHSSHGLLMIGDVNYDVASDLQSGSAAQDRTLPVDQLAVSLETNHSYGTLPGTRREIDFVRQSFEGTFNSAADRTISLTGVEATERRFRQEVSAYRYVHIATHGFFAPPERVSALEGFRSDLDGSNGSDSVDDELGSRLHVIHGTMPQLLSGLVFAGANRSPLPGRDDGILTAEEIAYIPLDRVDLVVLSACETGLGAAAGGEGLLGVQRAFQVAGARSTVATLWKIDDLVTQKLMSKFYENLWGKRMSKLDALRQAQLWILKNPDQLRDLTSDVRGVVRSDVQQPRQSPAYYWASFTLSGDWR